MGFGAGMARLRSATIFKLHFVHYPQMKGKEQYSLGLPREL